MTAKSVFKGRKKKKEKTASPYSSTGMILFAGAATLFVELALIRYIPGQLRVLGYFTNFVLLAAFLGFGVGILAHRRWSHIDWWMWCPPLTLLFIVLATRFGEYFQVVPSPEQFLFLEYKEIGKEISIYFFLTVSFILLAFSFFPLGFLVGKTLEGDRPLWRYGWNISGSLLGILLFVCFSLFSVRPWVWMLCAGLLSCTALLYAPTRWRIGGIVAIAAVSVLTWHATQTAIWSPYQKISLGPLYLHAKHGIIQEWQLKELPAAERRDLHKLPQEQGFLVRVNDDSYQHPIDLSDQAVKRHRSLKILQAQYDLPFRFKKEPEAVLILGAGTGNDVAGALRSGAKYVDAVEIDPEILRIGRQHPERPYEDRRVRTHLDDARSFLSQSEEV